MRRKEKINVGQEEQSIALSIHVSERRRRLDLLFTLHLFYTNTKQPSVSAVALEGGTKV